MINADNRRLQAAMATLLVLVLIATGAVLLLRPSSNPPSATAVAIDGSTGPGQFLTASTLPAGLAGRPVPQFDLVAVRGGRLASGSLR